MKYLAVTVFFVSGFWASLNVSAHQGPMDFSSAAECTTDGTNWDGSRNDCRSDGLAKISSTLCEPWNCPTAPLNIVWFTFSEANTNSATTGTTNHTRPNVKAGTSIRIGTCGMVGAAFSGRTHLRLWNLVTNTEITDLVQSRCAPSRGAYGSQLNYTVPYDMSIEVRAGCYANEGCSGSVVLESHFDSTPRLSNVKYAFTQILQSNPTLTKSYDPNTLIRGMPFQGSSYGGKHHFQGIARTYNRSLHDIVWTASVKSANNPSRHTIFFTKLNSRGAAVTQRLGSNLGSDPTLDKIEYGSNAAVYDGYNPASDRDWDGVPRNRLLDHSGGLHSIGNYVYTVSEFVSVGNNIPVSGQTSQAVGYDISQPMPQPQLLIARKGQGSGWIAIGKLPNTTSTVVPPMLKGGYLMIVPDGNRLSLYVQAADGCTGFASLSHVIPYKGGAVSAPNRNCFLLGRSPHTVGDARPIELVGCVKRGDSDPDCPELVTMYADGDQYASPFNLPFQFPDQDDVQSANFVTQTDGTLYLLAFVGYPDADLVSGPNSQVQLWRVVFGAASDIAPERQWLPSGTQCQEFLCLVREGTEAARDSFKGMAHEDINGNMFRYGGGGYVVPNANPAFERIYIYGTEHYLQAPNYILQLPSAALYNEF